MRRASWSDADSSAAARRATDSLRRGCRILLDAAPPASCLPSCTISAPTCSPVPALLPASAGPQSPSPVVRSDSALPTEGIYILGRARQQTGVRLRRATDSSSATAALRLGRTLILDLERLKSRSQLGTPPRQTRTARVGRFCSAPCSGRALSPVRARDRCGYPIQMLAEALATSYAIRLSTSKTSQAARSGLTPSHALP